MRSYLFLLSLLLCLIVTRPALCQDVDDDDDLDADAGGSASDDGEEITPDKDTDIPAKPQPVIEKTNVPVVKSTSNAIFLEEQFQDKKWSRWVKSQAKKEGVDESLAKYDGEWGCEIPATSVYKDDYALILKSKARHHAITVPLTKAFDFSTSPLVVQYEVKYQTNQECGGAYVKLLSEDRKLDLKQVTDKTPFTIMFGPDMCGVDHKYHFIIRYKNPKSGAYTEHQAKKPTESLDTYFTDKKSHLYTLVLAADNSFKMYIDNKLINSGSLLEDMEPAILPPKEIVDAEDRKPSDWDDQEKISDVHATKPDDWDESAPRQIVDDSATIPDGWLENEAATIPDPEAVKPEDWDEDTDGEWEAPQLDNPKCKEAPGCGKWTAPMISNPAYKGTWRAPLIDNPNYRGKWEPRKIPNPEYFEESHPYKLTPIGSLALELWSMVDGVVFDNFLITSDQSLAKKYGDQLWYPKSNLEGKAISSNSESVVDAIVNATKERPWLWAVYLVAVLLPLVILGAFCWSRMGKPAVKKAVDAAKKKTDEVTQDDEEEREPLLSSGRKAKNDEEDDEQVDEEIDTSSSPPVKATVPTAVRIPNTTTTTTTKRVATSKDALEEPTESTLDADNDQDEGLQEHGEDSGATSGASGEPRSSPSSKPRQRARKD